MSSQFAANTEKSIELALLVSSTLSGHRQTPYRNSTALNLILYPQYANAKMANIKAKAKRHQYCSPPINFGDIQKVDFQQMLSSHPTTTRVDFGCKYTHFSQYQHISFDKVHTNIQKINKLKFTIRFIFCYF